MSLNFEPYDADPEAIQWFREVLDNKGCEVQLFRDPYTELELGVFNPTPRLKRLIQRALDSRQRLPSSSQATTDGDIPARGAPDRDLTPEGTPTREPTPQSTPGRLGPAPASETYGSDLDEADVTQLDAAVQPDPDTLVYTATARNKAKIRRRKAKKAQSAAVIEGSPRPAGIDEWFTKAVAQYNITIDWGNQTRMREAAIAIAGRKVVLDWQSYYQCWRRRGYLASRPASQGNEGSNNAVARQLLPEVQALYRAYDDVRAADLTMTFAAIRYRTRMAKLGVLYRQAKAVIQEPLDPGQTKKGKRKRILFDLLHQEYQGIIDLKLNPAATRAWGQFNRCIHKGRRWKKVAEQLGYGILGLMPEDKIPNSWVERLTKVECALWFDAICYYNPKCLEAGQVWSRELQRALGGGGPGRKIRTLESVGNNALRAWAEPQQLFCEEVEVSGDEAVLPTRGGQGEGRVPDEWLRSSLIDMDVFEVDPQLNTRGLTEGQQAFLDNVDPGNFPQWAEAYPPLSSQDTMGWDQEMDGSALSSQDTTGWDREINGSGAGGLEEEIMIG